MAIRIEWLAKANRQVEGIFEYHKSVAGATVARKIVLKIHAATKILETNPLSAQREFALDDRPEEFRRLVVDNYKIVYHIEDSVVWITAVFDTRRNPVALRQSALGEE
jgi:plasmid stabilization system protein ParE